MGGKVIKAVRIHKSLKRFAVKEREKKGGGHKQCFRLYICRVWCSAFESYLTILRQHFFFFF